MFAEFWRNVAFILSSIWLTSVYFVSTYLFGCKYWMSSAIKEILPWKISDGEHLIDVWYVVLCAMIKRSTYLSHWNLSKLTLISRIFFSLAWLRLIMPRVWVCFIVACEIFCGCDFNQLFHQFRRKPCAFVYQYLFRDVGVFYENEHESFNYWGGLCIGLLCSVLIMSNMHFLGNTICLWVSRPVLWKKFL